MVWKVGKLSKDEPEKPFLRGKIHYFGFYLFLFFGSVLLILAKNEITRLCISIYLLSMLILFGTSTFFHTTTWENYNVEAFIQKVDHASIFLLITGTYTPVCVLLFDISHRWPLYVLSAAWIIGISGILKSIFIENPPKFFNVLFYFACGLSILPVLPKVFSSIGLSMAFSLLTGGILYLLGGTIYGIEWPDPSPKIYGYHEIFHTLTLLANLCFLFPIIINIIKEY